MLSYCLKCKKIQIKSTNPNVLKTNNGKTMYYQKVLYMVPKNKDL